MSVQAEVRRSPSRGPVATAAVVAVVLAVVFGFVSVVKPFSETAMTAFTDIGQLVGAALGGLGAALAAVRAWRTERQQLATAWGLIAAGVWSWAWGEAIWTGYEVMLGEEVPFPSFADVGFLGLPLLAGIGLLVWPVGADGGRDRLLAVADGALIGAGLLVLSWVTYLRATIAAGSGDTLGLLIGAAYPVGDVVLTALVVVLLTRAAPTNRTPLLILSGGLVSLAVADSAFMYGTSTGSYESGGILDVGWFAGFLAIGVAGLAMGASPTTRSRRRTGPSWRRLALPYVPAGLAMATIFWQLFTNGSLHVVETLSALVILVASWCRQYILFAENRELVEALEAGDQDEARRTRFRDPLTGLVSSALFEDRVQQARRRALRDGLPRAVLVVDLDDFGSVRQGLGEDAADELLLEVAERLRRCVRAGDSVARLRDDEFAVLLEAGHQSFDRVAQRVVDGLRTAVVVGGQPVPVTASVGMALYDARRVGDGAADLVTVAERAVVQAKTAGKNRFAAVTAIPRQGV
jgi:diguanylate cyclase (GGDEF)-like protein